MTSIDIPDIAIIGCGKVGTALAVLAAEAGLQVPALGDIDAAAAEAAADAVGSSTHPGTCIQAAGAAGLVFLTVPDDQIGPVCEELVAAEAFSPGTIVAHCSGGVSSEVLSSARDRCGCVIGSMHPMQTFPDVQSAVAELPGSYAFCEGDASAVEVLAAIATEIGCRTVIMDAANKPLYHAAAVTACNYLTTLMEAALTMMEQAGVERQVALESLMPLVHATVDNNAAMGPARALTGPIARGDVKTVQQHLRAIEAAGDETLLALYVAAGRATVDLAVKKGTLDNAAADRLRELLDT